jgi:ribosome-associated translation inhibitor RaiA
MAIKATKHIHMKNILLSISASFMVQIAIAQTPANDSNVVVNSETKPVVRTAKADSALIQLNNSLTKLGVSIEKLFHEAGLDLERGVDKLDKNLKDENLFTNLGKAIDNAAKSLEKATERLQRKIDDSASKKRITNEEGTK